MSWLTLQNALNDWKTKLEAGEPAVCSLGRGVIHYDQPLVVELSRNVVGGILDGAGAKLAGPGLTIRSRAVVRGLVFRDLFLDGGGLELDGGATAKKQFFYNVSLDRLRIEGGGLHLHGNLFETALLAPHIERRTTEPGTYGVLIEDGAGNVSSIDAWAGSIRGGEHNVYCPTAADLKWTGGTFLTAGAEAIRLNNAIGDVLAGCHVENAWESGPGGAGVYMGNQGAVRDLYATANNGKHHTALEVFSAGPGVEVDRVRTTGDVATAVRVKGGSRAVLRGVPSVVFPSGGTAGEEAGEVWSA